MNLNLSLLAPELSLAILAIGVILLDLVVERKAILPVVAAIGLFIPAAFTLGLWGLTPATGFAGILAVDDFALVFKMLFLGVALVVILASMDYAQRFSRFQGEYYALILLSTGGMMLMAATRELITIYLSLETASLSLYALAGFLKDQKSSEASLKYLLLGAMSSAVLLFGMALLFGLTGSTNLGDIAQGVARIGANNYPALLLGAVLVAAGFGFKVAAVPFQMWVPDVYEGAPTPVTAYLSVASKAAGFAVILRVFYEALGVPPVNLDWSLLFAVMAAAGMFLGNLAAIPQQNIKRMLGYSSIAQAGYMLVGLATLSSFGRSGVIFFLLAYAFTNLGAFIAIIGISNRTHSDEINDYAGMARRAPWLAVGLAFCLLSLTGIPPTAGFVAKLYLFKAAVDGDLAWLVLLAVINSAISAYYYLRPLKVMFLAAPASEEPIRPTFSLGLGLAIAVGGVLLLGIVPSALIGVAELAGAALYP